MSNKPPVIYLSINDICTQYPGLREKCRCTDGTLRNWAIRYLVRGRPLGVKVGGELRISPELLKEFLMGKGVPKMR